ADDRCRDEDAELSMLDSRDEAGDLAHANLIARLVSQTRAIAFGLKRKLHIDRIAGQAQHIAPEGVPSSIYGCTRDTIDDDARIMHLEDSSCEAFECMRRILEMPPDRAQHCSLVRSVRQLTRSAANYGGRFGNQGPIDALRPVHPSPGSVGRVGEPGSEIVDPAAWYDTAIQDRETG